MNKISIRGVLLGAFTDFALTNILAVPLVLYAIAHFNLSKLPPEQAQTAVIAAIHSNLWLTTIEMAIGLGCAALGGYVAAWVAKHDELLNGVLASFLCVGIGLYALLSGHAHSQNLQLLLILASPVFALFGGYARRAHAAARA